VRAVLALLVCGSLINADSAVAQQGATDEGATLVEVIALIGAVAALVGSYLQARQSLRKARTELEHAGDEAHWPRELQRLNKRRRWFVDVLVWPVDVSIARMQALWARLGDALESDRAPGHCGAGYARLSQRAGQVPPLGDVDEGRSPSVAEAAALRHAEHFAAISFAWLMILVGALLAGLVAMLELS